MGEVRELLPTTTEDERISALQANHEMAGQRELDKAPRDVVLRRAVSAAALANCLEPRVGSAKSQRARRDERVVQDVVGPGQQLAALDRDEVRVAGSGAHERDLAHPLWTGGNGRRARMCLGGPSV